MKYFLDTEFHEDGRIIDLISVGIVAENGREYYAISNEFDPEVCNPFVKAHVLPFLHCDPSMDTTPKSRSQIAADIVRFVGNDRPEFWADHASYDWIVICQLYGAMADLPKGWPTYINDVKQYQTATGGDFKFIRPAESVPHNALEDARMCRNKWRALRSYNRRRRGRTSVSRIAL